ncbi:Dyp-type peroxidase [Paucibacter sp. R3-3]|uniref:Dyp-type peroxidase n=1 Tax=Roseateles agri TaxID=3098619 RepID=A0ABU5DFH6_9BURK|nr:Dyp-type peroxidase domain-containing protein [Paucibacter sp. R3-3]MDY0744480.1 Dyp-type peroxidase [Paucibacter sp. R3-3]
MSSNRLDTQLQGITDLTLLTPIRPGFVEAFETITYVARLRTVLKTLNGLRLAARESTLPASPYTDVVSRYRIVHSFRWAIVDPAPGSGEPHKLLLNVCFDGGWEPYMRVIWRDLGSLLDIILCHCSSYTLSVTTSFERYAQWVRDNEIPPGFLFIESGRSVSDHEYLARQELLERSGQDGVAATRLHTDPPGFSAALPQPADQRLAMAIRGLPGLSALYLLARYFGDDAPDGACLLRATRDIFFELLALDTRALFPEGSPFRDQYYAQLGWLETVPPLPDIRPRELAYRPAEIQGGMLTGYTNLSSGALVLLHVEDAAKARDWLAAFRPSTEHDGQHHRHEPDGYYRNIALSLSGLVALGAGDAVLARFPQPFREGMEQRAGTLGDLRHNHPKYWKTPRRNWPAGDAGPIDMASVHLLLQLRQADPDAQPLPEVIAAILGADSGLTVLSVEAMRRNALPSHEGRGGPVVREHFGFVDGISQPGVDARPGDTWSDRVPRGELLLGYPTSRDRHAVPEQADALLDNGTFMVVRKLRQHVDRLNVQLDSQAAVLGLPKPLLLEKLMGRSLGGVPSAHPGESRGNDFDYRGDADGSRCPFHAHIRRANPRDRLPDGSAQAPTTPRLLRRGMSYGAAFDPHATEPAEKGLYFIAYNANIAEQFETIQRWLAGGNGSGGYSGQPDALMGVAEPGKPRLYRVEIDGRAVTIDLGDQPFVELQWGAYYFVPSPAALKNIATLLAPQPTPAPRFKAPPVDDFAGWQLALEDTATRDLAWAHVRAQPGGALRTAYGVLVGDAKLVMQVLRNAPDRYSVRGYGERMLDSVGLGYLGLDADTGHTEQAPLVNAAIEAIGEQEAFERAYIHAKAFLAPLRATAAKLQLAEATLDLEQLSLRVLAALCTDWFGLPDGLHMWGTEFHPASEAQAPRCPRDFVAVSRHVFGPHPSPTVDRSGRAAGVALQKSVKDWLATVPDLGQLDIVRRTLEAVAPLKAQGDATIEERTLAGIMLGFPPTVHGNLLTALGGWAASKALWDLQLQWPSWTPSPDPKTSADAAQDAAPAAYARATQTLRAPLLKMMMRSPVPAQIWRYAKGVPHKLGEVSVMENDLLVVGIASAAAQAGCSHFVPFGGDRNDAVKPAPLHACPGYAMAMGVMMGVVAAVLEAGTLRASPIPTVLTLPVLPGEGA